MIFNQDDQNHSDHEDQDKYGKANTFLPFSILYTKKLTSPKRRKFFLRAVVIKSAGCYICLIVLLNSRVYIWEGLDMFFRLCLPNHIVCRGGNQALLIWTYCPAREMLPFFKLQRVYFRSFYFRGFITVKTPELFSLYNLHCEFYMRPKGDLFE